MNASNLSIAPTIPQGIVLNNTQRAYTFGYLIGTINHMPELTNLQQLLKHVRDTYCKGSAAELSRKIGKADTYVNRLFYPVDKRGHKGIGLEIMTSCTKAFSLPPGFWEMNVPVLQSSTTDNPSESTRLTGEPGGESYFGWPFSDRIRPWQYDLLGNSEKAEVEEFVLFKLSKVAKDPPAQQQTPANNERTGTHA